MPECSITTSFGECVAYSTKSSEIVKKINRELRFAPQKTNALVYIVSDKCAILEINRGLKAYHDI